MEHSIKGTQTEQNLLKAFAGESQARNKYTYYAKIADKEGYKQIADLFLQTAEHERMHAKRFYKFLEGGSIEITTSFNTNPIGTTIDNLKDAALGEQEEWHTIYPKFAEIAEKEGFKQIAVAFKTIAQVEAGHEKRFQKLLQNIEQNEVFEKNEITKWHCRKCGYIYEGKKALETCPACLHPKSYFEKLAENY